MNESTTTDPPERKPTSAEGQVERLSHELGVHRIELESQNEELRRAQCELETARDRYVDLYERAPIAYVTLSPDGTILETNRLAVQLLRADLRPIEGRLLAEFLHPNGRPQLQLLLQRSLLDRSEHSIELQLAGGGDSPHWVALQIVAGAESGAVQCRAALIDITERVRMQRNASLLAAVVASSEDAIISRDFEGRVTSWNDAATRLFGFTSDEVLGDTLEALVPAERMAEERRLLRHLRAGQVLAHVETERLRKGGSPLHVSMTLSPIRDLRGGVTGSSLIVRDISERRRAERVLHERLRHLDVLSEAGQMLILGEQDVGSMRRELFERVRVSVGSDLRMTYAVCHDAGQLTLLSSFGLDDATRAELTTVRTTDTLCGLVAQRRAQLVLDDLQSSTLHQAARLKALGARCYAGFPMQAHGRLYGVAAFASTQHDRFGDGDLLVMRTVCDQVSAMMERNRLLQELHASEQTLKSADRAKDDFIATLAHELRSPLAPIRNALGILRLPALSTPQQQDWCRDIIERQILQMTRLLEDLLDLGRLSRNKIQLRRERMELARAIEQAVEAIQPLMDTQGQRFRLQLPDVPMVVNGDLTRLTQVFSNLLSNAVKYSDAGSAIVLRAQIDGEQALVSVSDAGIGIDAQQLPQVFEMFAQLAPAIERAGGGLGIGLALARGLVELHGGMIEAHSDGPGKGSEFVVRLPLEQMPHAMEEAPHDANFSARESRQRRLLVVDDNVDAAQTLAAALEMHGHDVRAAFSGADALRIACEWQPEVGLFDIGMPGMNGYELCRLLRAERLNTRPLLVACTGWGQESDRERALAAGFDLHLVKPVDLAEVLALLVARSDPPG